MLNKTGWGCGVSLLLVLGLAACGGPTGQEEFQAGDETPPATAGSLESLMGTTWQLAEGQTLAFGENGQGEAGRAGGGLPMSMRYELQPNGVITVVIVGASRSGTWDGTTLIIDGEKAQRVQ